MQVTRRFREIVAVALFLPTIVSTATAQYGGGSGTKDDPYLIWTAEQLNAVGTEPNDWDKHFQLMADIDLSAFDGREGRPAFNVVAPDVNEIQAGFQGVSFSGVLDGNGHAISRLTINGGGYLGLLGQLTSEAEVRDLGVVDVNISGSRDYVGGLIGHNGGHVVRCYSTGTVVGVKAVGGLAGGNSRTIARCHSIAQVIGSEEVGGLTGLNEYGHVTDCHSAGVVDGSNDVGGLVGRADYGAVTYCYSMGTVNGRGSRIGGLVGSTMGDVTCCYSSAAIGGTGKQVGGLVGCVWGPGAVTHCFSTGPVSGQAEVGGLLGLDWGGASGCFWDMETCGQVSSSGGMGLTTAEMQDLETYLDAGWDWVGETARGTCEIWQMPAEGGYPVLATFSGYTSLQLQGQGTPGDPYLIKDALELGAIVHYGPYAHYRLAAPVDLSGTHWGMAVIPCFEGVFDGNGLTVSHLTIEGMSDLGLFGRLVPGGQVVDLGVVDVNVVAYGDCAGALVGWNYGDVVQCYSTGAVTGLDYGVGGLVGENFAGGVTRSYSTVTVMGSDSVGGLVGCNSNGDISHSYSSGPISGNSTVGGLVGANSATTTCCYSTGVVTGDSSVGGLIGSGGASGCFWDIETSGQTTSAAGTGLATARMQRSATFALWADPVHGAIWKVDEGNDYPRLLWEEDKPGQAIVPVRLGDSLAGLGTADDPYQIETPTQFNLIGRAPWDWDKHFKLMADIDMSGPVGTEFNIIGIDPYTPFTGVFDGNGKTISHLTCSWTGRDYVGLFGYVAGEEASIRNVHLVDPNVAGGSYVGSLAGWVATATIQDCGIEGAGVDGTDSVGGLIGYNSGVVIRCSSAGAVHGAGASIGGLVGANYGGSVTQCYSSGVVSGSSRVGGLVGSESRPYGRRRTITDSYSTATATATTENAGGLVGYNEGTIVRCYSTGPVAADTGAGGLVGAGGFGFVITACFWDIETSGQATSAGGTGKSTADMRIARTFYPWVTCGNEAGIWTLDEGNNYPRLQWENKPGTAMEPVQLSDFLTGAGTAEDPYLIYTADELSLIGLFACELDKHFKLMADIDLGLYGGTSFPVVGTGQAPFTGVFDGNDHAISNFRHASTNSTYIGLFGYVADPNAQIRNLGLIDPNVEAAGGSNVGSLVGYLSAGTISGCYVEGGGILGGSNVGGLVGWSSGTISGCCSTAGVTGDTNVGGLVGGNGGDITTCYTAAAVAGASIVGGLAGLNSGAITSCFADTSVTGTETLGGLAGSNGGTVRYCHATGDVTGDQQVGGLVGSNGNVVINSFSTGVVAGGGLVGQNNGSVFSSFWDIETSGTTASAAGAGKSTAEMKRADTFLGWGCERAWTIEEGESYPRLLWEGGPGELMAGCSLWQGSGTEDDPFLIHTADELNAVAQIPHAWDRCFRLVSDADLSEFADEFNPIGMSAVPFKGTFDGDGHTISNLRLIRPSTSRLGLFGYVDDPNARIEHLRLTDPNVQGAGYVGALVGTLVGGTITDCCVRGVHVSGNATVGGLAGSCGGTLTDCHIEEGAVTGNMTVGGLAGSGVRIVRCSVQKVEVVAKGGFMTRAGGLAATATEIIDCRVAGGLVRGNADIGGLVAYMTGGTISGCCTSTHVEAAGEGFSLWLTIGGLVGDNGATIENSYSTSSVTQGNAANLFAFFPSGAGGLVGYNRGTIRLSYSTGAVVASTGGGFFGMTLDVGGLAGLGPVGSGGAVVEHSFWDVETSGQAASAGGEGKTTAQMQTAGTFLEAGWDFVEETANGADDIWWIDEGKDYPHLWWEMIEEESSE